MKAIIMTFSEDWDVGIIYLSTKFELNNEDLSFSFLRQSDFYVRRRRMASTGSIKDGSCSDVLAAALQQMDGILAGMYTYHNYIGIYAQLPLEKNLIVRSDQLIMVIV